MERIKTASTQPERNQRTSRKPTQIWGEHENCRNMQTWKLTENAKRANTSHADFFHADFVMQNYSSPLGVIMATTKTQTQRYRHDSLHQEIIH